MSQKIPVKLAIAGLLGLSSMMTIDLYYFEKLPVILQLFSLLQLMIVPGFMTLLALKIRFNNFWLYIFHSFGLSVFWVYVLGLLGSELGPQLGYLRPLDLNPFLFVHSGLLLALSAIAVLRNWREKIDLSALSRSGQNVLAYLAAIGLSLISVAGAFSLNNGGSNVFAIGWIVILLAAYFVISLFQSERLKQLNPFIIFMLSLSILWSLAARSWHLIGWDIVQEFGVASSTLQQGKWSMDVFRDAYNACLSITILPAVISNFTRQPLEPIMKYFYPYLFAHFPVMVYFLSKKFANGQAGMMAVLYIIAQPFFIQPMVALARQEVSFFFFALLLLTIYAKTNKVKTRAVLVTLYLFSLVTSHYSTTYVSIIIFSLTFAAIFFLGFVRLLPMPMFIKKTVVYENWVQNFRSGFKWWMLFLLIGFTYGWYFMFTQSAGNVAATVTNSLNNMSRLFKGDQQSEEIKRSLPGMASSLNTTQSDLNIFVQTYTGGDLQGNLKQSQIDHINRSYPVKPMTERYLVPSLPAQYAKPLNAGLSYYKDILKYLIIAGTAILVIKSFFSREQNLEFVLLSSVSTGFLLLMIFHPTLGLSYNVSRIYLQLMVFLALTLIVTIDNILFFVKSRIKYFAIGLAMVLAFIYFQGILSPYIGGVPVLSFYNYGTDYEKFYVFQGELSAAKWLQKNRNFKNTVYADELTGLRLRKEANFFPNTTILPLVVANNAEAYVYLSATNKLLKKTQVTFNNKFLTYEYPQNLFDNHKNLIYSNPHSTIYK